MDSQLISGISQQGVDRAAKADKAINALESSIRRLDQQAESEFEQLMGEQMATNGTEEGGVPKTGDKKLRQQLQQAHEEIRNLKLELAMVDQKDS